MGTLRLEALLEALFGSIARQLHLYCQLCLEATVGSVRTHPEPNGFLVTTMHALRTIAFRGHNNFELRQPRIQKCPLGFHLTHHRKW